jgi:DNA-binding NtrC family response regulator
MLRDKAILIVDDNVYLALDLSHAVEASNGRVVGPVGTVAETLALLERETIAAAVIGSHLVDGELSTVLMALTAKDVPYVIQTDAGAPSEVARSHPNVPILVQPLRADEVVRSLVAEITRSRKA